MGNRTTIRDFYGKIIGYLETKDNGDVQATDFYGRILGFYRKSIDKTVDFYGKILASGDITAGLIYQSDDTRR